MFNNNQIEYVDKIIAKYNLHEIYDLHKYIEKKFDSNEIDLDLIFILAYLNHDDIDYLTTLIKRLYFYGSVYCSTFIYLFVNYSFKNNNNYEKLFQITQNLQTSNNEDILVIIYCEIYPYYFGSPVHMVDMLTHLITYNDKPIWHNILSLVVSSCVNPVVYYNLGNFQFKNGNLSAAIESYSKANELAPDFFNSILNLACCYMLQYRY